MKATPIDETIRAIVREELRAMLGPNVTVYTSTTLPPGITSREHFAAECRRLGIGEKHGRVWTVPADAWRTARARKRPALHVVASDIDRADAYLDGALARQTRGR